jgi:hypothetical protein
VTCGFVAIKVVEKTPYQGGGAFVLRVVIKSMTHTSPPRNHPGGSTNTLRFGGGYETGDQEGELEAS